MYLYDYNEIFKQAIARVIQRERKLRTDKFTIFCYENSIPKTTLNSIELGKNDSSMTTIFRIMNCMYIEGREFMDLVNEELPDNFWAEWRLAEPMPKEED